MSPQFSLSEITDSEIAWAAELMGLGADGFAVLDGDESRMNAMRCLNTCDFEACPGSGKTTLLVAKLAVLASRWPYRHRGICVLSHTNAARDEIDQRLSAAGPSAALVRYPHFIGTIHGFVNEYLALPWLRSKGNPVRSIDTAIALNRRFHKVPWNFRAAMESRHLNLTSLQYDKTDYSGANKGKLARDTDLCRAMEAAARAGSEEGYLCFDEMFVWANEYLDRHPEMVLDLRTRFPLVFIDEAQDNSELQSSILHRIFTEGEAPSIRQRFGDSNQAIFSSVNASGAETDAFPSALVHNLPRSYRFSRDIANVARGFGVVPQALVGAGPVRHRVKRAALPSVLFLFDDGSVGEVLPRYAQHLCSEFNSEELAAGTFTAVAGVHELDEGESKPTPGAMGHYAPSYDPALVRREGTPESFSQFLAKASREINRTGNAQALVNALASALLRLCELTSSSTAPVVSRKSAHRRLLDSLGRSDGTIAYQDLLDRLLTSAGQFSESEWEVVYPLIMRIITTLTGAKTLSREAQEFVSRPVASNGKNSCTGTHAPTTDNFYSYPPDNAKVLVRLGSIHSVKGETHTATLVLDSYFHKHHLVELKPWLLGTRSGGLKQKSRGSAELEGPRLLGRLKLHYVAMTRPSHLLCLAMRRDAFSDVELEQLRSQGWMTVDCVDRNGPAVPTDRALQAP